MGTSYVYPGFSKFADQAAADHGVDGHLKGKISHGWHVKAITGALARLPGTIIEHPDSAPEVVDRIKTVRDGLAAQLAAVDLAIDEVLGAIDPPRNLLLKDEKQPKPKRNRRAKAKPAIEPEPTDDEEAQGPEDEHEEDAESAD